MTPNTNRKHGFEIARGLLLGLLVSLAFHVVAVTPAEAAKLQKQHRKADLAFRKHIANFPPNDFDPSVIKPFTSEKDIRLAASGNPDKLYQVFAHVDRPIIFILFSTTELQDLMMDRISVFVEENNLSTDGLADHPYEMADGHDLRGSDIALFFSRMKRDEIELTIEEERLLYSLLHSGYLRVQASGEYVAALPFAVAAAASDAASGADSATIMHELCHMLYMTDRTYADRVTRFFSKLPFSMQEKIRGTILELGYASAAGKPDILYTEFAAYFRDPAAFKEVLERVGVENRFLDTELSSLERQLKQIERGVPLLKQD